MTGWGFCAARCGLRQDILRGKHRPPCFFSAFFDITFSHLCNKLPLKLALPPAHSGGPAASLQANSHPHASPEV